VGWAILGRFNNKNETKRIVYTSKKHLRGLLGMSFLRPRLQADNCESKQKQTA
jgi:hypothetical protein